MKKFLFPLVLFSSLTFAVTIQENLEQNPKKFTEILIDLSPSERKDICLKTMNDNVEKDPIVAFSAGNCLLYNGYGNLAIPLFTTYIYNGQNKAFFNNRIGYGWLHSANWYKIDTKIINDMTNGQELHIWVGKKIKEELYKNPSKYNVDVLSLKLRESMSSYLKSNPFSSNEKETFKKCRKININFDNISCDFVNRKYTNCKIDNSDRKNHFLCTDK